MLSFVDFVYNCDLDRILDFLLYARASLQKPFNFTNLVSHSFSFFSPLINQSKKAECFTRKHYQCLKPWMVKFVIFSPFVSSRPVELEKHIFNLYMMELIILLKPYSTTRNPYFKISFVHTCIIASSNCQQYGQYCDCTWLVLFGILQYNNVFIGGLLEKWLLSKGNPLKINQIVSFSQILIL